MTRVEELTWPAIGQLVDGGETLALLPVGATEQHGRHLPVQTDSLIAERLCHEASERTGVPVLPTLSIGASAMHTAHWPGTLSLSPRLLIAIVVELATWVRASGFRRLVVVNAHVGNAAPLAVATDEIRCAGTLRVGLVNWYELSPEINAEVARDAEDWHANAAETSLLLHLEPGLVRRDEIADDPDRTPGLALRYTATELSTHGVTGRPSDATAAAGARLFGQAVAALCERITHAREELPPLEAAS